MYKLLIASFRKYIEILLLITIKYLNNVSNLILMFVCRKNLLEELFVNGETSILTQEIDQSFLSWRNLFSLLPFEMLNHLTAIFIQKQNRKNIWRHGNVIGLTNNKELKTFKTHAFQVIYLSNKQSWLIFSQMNSSFLYWTFILPIKGPRLIAIHYKVILYIDPRAQYLWIIHHHHYHVVLLARISLTFSRHFSLSSCYPIFVYFTFRYLYMIVISAFLFGGFANA